MWASNPARLMKTGIRARKCPIWSPPRYQTCDRGEETKDGNRQVIMEETGTLKLFELSFSDLFFISSHRHDEPLPTPAELRRLDSVKMKIMEALGPAGPGLLAVSGILDAADLRQNLSFARDLALLDSDLQRRTLKEQGLGTDVPLKDPERKVSSFAMQLKYERDSVAEEFDDYSGNYKHLGRNLKKLGLLMMEIGLRIARVCDVAIGAGHELEQSLLDSSTAKARLIHYHSDFDRRFLRKRGLMKSAKNSKRDERNEEKPSSFDLWQEWHYDYGMFTVLAAPVFLSQQHGVVEEYRFPGDRTLLQVFDPRKKEVFDVKASPESFIVQVGESAQVISEGKLQATLHSVSRPEKKLENLSRETFVVFLQPAWDKVMRIASDDTFERSSDSDDAFVDRIRKIVPPLASRLKNGMTFADFSRETTRQYYSGKGLQSKS